MGALRAMTNFNGNWSGYTEGNAGGRIYLKTIGSADHQRAVALIIRSDGISELYRFRGGVQSDTLATYTMDTVVVDAPYVTLPRRLRVESKFDATTGEIQAKWSTDIQTFGTAWLRKQHGFTDVLLAIPYWVHSGYRHAKRFARKWFRYTYLLFIVAIATNSALGKTDVKLNLPETILLITPLAFLFADKIRLLINYVGLRKAGPLEFQDQAQAPHGGSVDGFVASVRTEFGNAWDKLVAVAQFFVPRTTYLLRLMAHYGRPLTDAEFDEYAQSIGVPVHDINATKEALITSSCVERDSSGKLAVAGFGALFLRFIARTGAT